MTNRSAEIPCEGPLAQLSGKSTEEIETRLLGHGEVYACVYAVRHRVAYLPLGEAFEPTGAAPPLDESGHVPLPPAKTLACHDALHLSKARIFDRPGLEYHSSATLILLRNPTGPGLEG